MDSSKVQSIDNEQLVSELATKRKAVYRGILCDAFIPVKQTKTTAVRAVFPRIPHRIVGILAKIADLIAN